MKRKKMVIVGGGLSGLTAGAYLLRYGHEVLILEKASRCGGLVGSFARDGFVFDTGPRALGDSGILRPMLEDLRIDLPLADGPVSFGIRDEIVHFEDNRGVGDFIASLGRLFPESAADIGEIEKKIRVYCSLAFDLNRVPNPYFKNPLRDVRFLFREFLPRLPSFLRVLIKTSLRKKSIEEALRLLTDNPSLRDMLSQHFFKGTPAGFAFGYFENFRDYKYSAGGTGRLPLALERRIRAAGGVVKTDREAVKVLPAARMVLDQRGEAYPYDRLLWAADLRSLYRRLEDTRPFRAGVRRAVAREAKRFLAAPAGESAFLLFLGVDLPPEYFARISRGHFIYTPNTRGLGELHRSGLEELKKKFGTVPRLEVFQWLKAFCERNSYEISIPVLKDQSLAPPGKTGLVISLLVDGPLFELVDQAGWPAEFRAQFQEYMIDALDRSIYPGLRKKIIFAESATPLTLMKRFGNSDGAITGWSLEHKAPVPDSLAGIMAAVRTSIPNVYRAGQWSYSPAGVPIAILTGRIAAGAMSR